MATTRWVARALGVLVLIAAVALSFVVTGTRSSTPANTVAKLAAAAQTFHYPTDVDATLPNGTSQTLAQLRTLAPNTTVSTGKVNVEGLARSYLLIAPTAQSGPLPLIVFLSGRGVTPAIEASRDGDLLTLATTGKAILVYPTSYNQGWNVGADGCCGDAVTQHVDDVAFIRTLIPTLRHTLRIAANSTFLGGYSNGGKMAYQLMCQLGTTFDAAAISAATPLQSCSATAQPARSIMMLVGANDTELPISGASTTAAQALTDGASSWLNRDGCANAASSIVKGAATITTTANCTDDAKVTTVVYATVAHDFVTSSLTAKLAVGTPSTPELMWEFFTDQPLGSTPLS